MTDRKSIPHAILIVEDDPLLQLLTVDIVEASGFIAVQAANADEAVAILEARSDIALLLTDINMPGSMDGLKLAHAVRDRWPPIKSSSYPAELQNPSCRRIAAFPASPILAIHLSPR